MESVLPVQSLYITFIVDSSGSIFVDGHRNKISHAVRTLVQELSSISRQTPNQLKVFSRLLNYSSKVRWHDDSKKYSSISNLKPSFPHKGYLSNFGFALNEYRSVKPLLKQQGKNILIWISDGFVTDDWAPAFSELSSCPAFKDLMRFAIYPEGNVKFSTLEKFCGNVNHVISTKDIGYHFCQNLIR